MGKFKAISIVILCNIFVFCFLDYLFVMKITIEFSCEYSSMLTSSIIDVERNHNHSMNIILSLGTIPCIYFVTIMLYI